MCDSFILFHVAVTHLYLLLLICRIPFWDYTIIYWSVLLSMEIWIVLSYYECSWGEKNYSVPFMESTKKQIKPWIISWLLTMLINSANWPAAPWGYTPEKTQGSRVLALWTLPPFHTLGWKGQRHIFSDPLRNACNGLGTQRPGSPTWEIGAFGCDR